MHTERTAVHSVVKGFPHQIIIDHTIIIDLTGESDV